MPARRFTCTMAAITLCIMGAFVTDSPAAQLANMQRGSEHERLDFLVGEWRHEGEQTILGERVIVSSRIRYEWLPGGVWLHGVATIWGLPGIEQHHGWAQIGFDSRTGEYVHVWFDNQSAVLFVNRGTWLNDRVLELTGSHEWAGQSQFTKNIFTIVSDREWTWEFLVSQDGQSYARRTLSVYRRID